MDDREKAKAIIRLAIGMFADDLPGWQAAILAGKVRGIMQEIDQADGAKLVKIHNLLEGIRGVVGST